MYIAGNDTELAQPKLLGNEVEVKFWGVNLTTNFVIQCILRRTDMNPNPQCAFLECLYFLSTSTNIRLGIFYKVVQI
jgi:hypothetical protein